jgi:integrase
MGKRTDNSTRRPGITRRPDGRYRARYRDASGGEHVKHFPTFARAEQWQKEQQASVVRHDHVAPRRAEMRFADWVEQWLASRAHLKPKTIASYRSLLDTRILPTWRDVKLSAITNADVATWVAGMRAAGLSASRVRQAFHLFGAALDDAVRDRRLASNPAAGVRLPKLPTTERRYLDHGQLEALANACGEHRTLVLVLGYCGIRWGEAAALRVRNVNPMRGRVAIVEAVVEVNGRVVLGSPKTHQHREVVAPAFLRDELAAQLAGKAPGDLVFPAPRGGVLRVGNFRRATWDKACVSVGLGEMVRNDAAGTKRYVGLSPHGLRHTAASLAIASGATVKGVQAMLGHASATLTLDRYGHLFGDELDAVAERMDAARTAMRTGSGQALVVDLAERVK